MSFLKQAALSLGLALASGAYVRAEEPLKPSLEQILKTTEKAAKKIALEYRPAKNGADEQCLQWIMLGQKIGFSTSNYYALPDGFKLTTRGTVEGYGFSWKINESELYHDRTPVRGFFDGFHGSSYKDLIFLDGKSLRAVMDDYEAEKGFLGEGMRDNANDLKGNLSDIAGGKYSDKLTIDSILYLSGLFMLYEDSAKQKLKDSELADKIVDLSREFYDGEVTEQDRKDLQDAANSFFQNTDWLLDQTKTGKTYKAVMDDPMMNISFGGNTLNEINEMFGDIKKLIKYSISEKGLWAKLDLTAKGQTSSDLSEKYLLKRGELNADFNHAISYSSAAYAHAFMNADLRLSEGGDIYLYLDENGVRLSGQHEDEGMELYNIYLPSISLKLDLGYEYGTRRVLAESFQLSRLTRTGMDGIGIALRMERLRHYASLIKSEGKLDMDAATAQGQISFTKEAYRLNRERALAYFFSQGLEDRFWYYLLLGMEYDDKSQYDSHDSRSYSFSAEMNNGIKESSEKSYQKNSYEKMSAAPRANAGAGLIGERVNPFMTYISYPYEAIKIGAMLDIPLMPSRIAMSSANNKMNLEQASLTNNENLALETSLILFDKKGNKKALDYYTSIEQDQMHPTEGKMTEQMGAMVKFYSDINGLLINTKMEGSNYRLRGLWGAEESLFLGAGYFTNTEENLKGGELILGCDRFSLIGGFGKSQQDNGYGNMFTLSAGGALSETMLSLDMHGIFGPFSKDNRYYNQYRGSFQGTLNISGKFDETNQLKRITKEIIETLRRKRRDR